MDDCVICLEPLEDPRRLVACGHAFHPKCIQRCGQMARKFCPVCPLCRAHLVECELGIEVVARFNADPGSPSTEDIYVLKTAADLGCIAAAFTLGNIYHNQNAQGMDEHYWKMAVNYSGACNNLAFLFYSRGDLAEAAVYFRRAIELKPTCAVYYLNLAKMLGPTLESNALFLRALSLLDDPETKAAVFFTLGNNTYKQGNAVNAYYEECVRLKPSHFQARLMAALTGDDPVAGHAHADAVLAAMPDNVGALCLKGRLYMRQKNRAAAEPLFRRALKIVPPGRSAEEIEANLQPFGPLTRKRARLCL